MRCAAASHIGWGPYSKPSTPFCTNVAAPSRPSPPRFLACTPTEITVEWDPPFDNGAVVDEYEIQWRLSSPWGKWSLNPDPLVPARAATARRYFCGAFSHTLGAQSGGTDPHRTLSSLR